jgi:sigma-B regulation protein RsbU (phosphoserine phosphatase)
VIGLLPKACYEKGSLLLRPGDLLIAYTNGISEAMNSNQQEWGEDPMIVAAEQWADESAEGILKAIFGQPTVLSVAHRSTTT